MKGIFFTFSLVKENSLFQSYSALCWIFFLAFLLISQDDLWNSIASVGDETNIFYLFYNVSKDFRFVGSCEYIFLSIFILLLLHSWRFTKLMIQITCWPSSMNTPDARNIFYNEFNQFFLSLFSWLLLYKLLKISTTQKLWNEWILQ